MVNEYRFLFSLVEEPAQYVVDARKVLLSSFKRTRESGCGRIVQSSARRHILETDNERQLFEQTTM